ncbi:MAG: hypothetical protein HY316_10440 [Acidobacteria bacterium]|nr:hypothetical protein [Acidobacteriota bacterium]
MGVNDFFPVPSDYGFQLTREANLLRGRAESGHEFLREKGAPQRIFVLVFNGRKKSDWDVIQNFRHAMRTDFFTYEDKEAGRKYSVYFHTEPEVQIIGNQRYAIRLSLIEAIGVAMQTYPDFGGSYPFVNIPVAQAQDLGANGKLFLYGGYGYRVNGSFTSIYLDEQLTGGENPKTDVVLGLHRVRVVGGSPISLDYLI